MVFLIHTELQCTVNHTSDFNFTSKFDQFRVWQSVYHLNIGNYLIKSWYFSELVVLSLATNVGVGHGVAQLVEVLLYKADGRGFDFRWPSSRTMTLGLTQPLAEMSTRNISWRVKATGA